MLQACLLTFDPESVVDKFWQAVLVDDVTMLNEHSIMKEGINSTLHA